MAAGGIIGVAEVAVGLLAGWLFLDVATWLAAAWADRLVASPAPDYRAMQAQEDAKAAALVPEFAAARFPPDYPGRCRCRACRNRPSEPCSDYDGV